MKFNKKSIHDNIQKKKLPKWMVVIIILTIIAVLAIVCLIIFGKEKDVNGEYDSNGNPVYVENSKISDIFTNTDSYKGQFVDFSGRVFTDPESSDGTLAFQMWTDPVNLEKDIVVYYNGNLDLKTDDYVKLTGYIYGTLEGENAFGASVTAPIIVATKLEKSSYMDVVEPTLKSIEYTDKVINQQGYQIEVTKVEFAENETRVYVTATNNTNEEFSIYTYSVTAIQGNKQYEVTSNYDADYSELQSDLQPSVTSSGILVFDSLEQSDFRLVIEGSSSNWDIDLENYAFDLELK